MSKSIEELKAQSNTNQKRHFKNGSRRKFRTPRWKSWLCRIFLQRFYGKVMNYKLPFSMEGKGEDHFYLSNGHISPVFYSTLARNGFFPISELSLLEN